MIHILHNQLVWENNFMKLKRNVFPGKAGPRRACAGSLFVYKTSVLAQPSVFTFWFL